MLQEIRDESHRFALQSQRNKKRKKLSKSVLDSVKGVGFVLKKRILSKFKSIEKLKLVNCEELMTVQGINEKIALEILKKLRDD